MRGPAKFKSMKAQNASCICQVGARTFYLIMGKHSCFLLQKKRADRLGLQLGETENIWEIYIYIRYIVSEHIKGITLKGFGVKPGILGFVLILP